MKSKKEISASTPPAVRPPPTNDQVAALAHAIWIDRGRPEGAHLEHWFEAERQLRGGGEPLAESNRLDPETAPAARIDRELDRVVGRPPDRSVTSL